MNVCKRYQPVGFNVIKKVIELDTHSPVVECTLTVKQKHKVFVDNYLDT